MPKCHLPWQQASLGQSLEGWRSLSPVLDLHVVSPEHLPGTSAWGLWCSPCHKFKRQKTAGQWGAPSTMYSPHPQSFILEHNMPPGPCLDFWKVRPFVTWVNPQLACFENMQTAPSPCHVQAFKCLLSTQETTKFTRKGYQRICNLTGPFLNSGFPNCFPKCCLGSSLFSLPFSFESWRKEALR